MADRKTLLQRLRDSMDRMEAQENVATNEISFVEDETVTNVANGMINPVDLVQAFMAQAQSNKGTTLTAGDDIKYHDDPAIMVPRGMTMEKLAEVAEKKARELNKIHIFRHATNYRPNDGAYAAFQVMKEMFGMTIGKSTFGMFGQENPPEFINVEIGYGQKVEVPWGAVEIPAIPGAEFHFGALPTADRGPVFNVVVKSPKKHKDTIEEMFRRIDQYLATNSIYRGQALLGAHELSFMNVNAFKANEIVFADDVQRTIDAAINGLLRHTEATVKAGLPTKRSVLAFGPYGTGKSSLGLITAQIATQEGWTFLSAKAGKDDLRAVMQTAKLYEPAVVFVEDIDTHTPNVKDQDAVSEILDLFDGISAKDSKLLVVMTTNHIEKVPAGMLRPGRLDYTVEIAGLDRNAVERLVNRVVPNYLLADYIDFDAVYEEMHDWQPAWVRATADRAQTFAISRAGGALSYELTTDDFVGAAKSLAPQLTLMDAALEGYEEPELTEVMQRTIRDQVVAAIDNSAIVDRDDDKVYEFTIKPEGSINWEASTN